MLFAPYCFRIFTDEPLVIQYAIEIMGYFVPFYFLWTCIEILANSLRGSGDALVPMVISVGGICGLRILWVFLVVPHWNTLMGISICYPVSWAVTVAVLILYVLLPGEVEAVVTAPSRRGVSVIGQWSR